MLYERWQQIARAHSSEIALRDLPSARQWTFAQLDQAAQERDSSSAVVFPRGNNAEFLISVLRAWRHGQALCPLEPSQAAPSFDAVPHNIVHLKSTSATAGTAKWVAFTAEQLASDAANIVATMKLQRDWPNLAFISLAHSYGFSNLVTPLLLHGIPLVLGGMPLPEIVRSAGEKIPNLTLASVPALWRAWSDAKAIPPSVRLAISAGAPLPLSLEQHIFETHGLKIHNFYGASECGGIAYDASEHPRADSSCVGAPLQNVALSVNAQGCLEVRGNSVGESYFPERAADLAGGTYFTADLVEIQNGLVFLRGRASDFINIAGRKVAPESVETILAAHPSVRQCIVFGVPSTDAQRGEMIVACVVRHNDTGAEELRQFIRNRSEPWQTPREFWFVDSLIANERGKLSRAEWRARFLRQRERNQAAS